MADLFTLVGTIAIDATDATQKIEATISAAEDLEGVLNGIGANAESSFGSKSAFGAASVWLGNTITELTNRAAQLGKEFVLSGLKYNAAMEGYEVTFGTLLNGDMEKAKKLMADIQAFALNSPLSASGVSAAALQLLNVGTAYEDVMPMLEMLGNLSLGDASKMDRLGTALSQVMGFGQLYGQEKQQFVNAGVPLYTLLEDYYKIVGGKSAGEINLGEMQRGGQITAEHVLGALQLATMSNEEVLAKYGFSGDRAVSFYNAMAAMLPTYTGQTQKAGEQTEITAGAVVAPFQEKATEDVLPAYTEMMAAAAEKFENDEGLKKGAKTIGDFFTGIFNSVSEALSGKYDVTPENAENLTPFGKFTTGIYGLEDLWNALRKKEVDTDADGGGGFRFGEPEDKEGNLGGSLKQLNENMHNLNMLFASASGVPERKSEETGRGILPWIGDTLRDALSGGGFDRGMGANPYEHVDNAANTSAIVSALSGIQSAMAALPAQVEAGAAAGAAAGCAAGVGSISVTGTVTTGTVMLNTGAIVGSLTPKLDLSLGGLYKRAARM